MSKRPIGTKTPSSTQKVPPAVEAGQHAEKKYKNILTVFAEWNKPYREFATLLSGIFITISTVSTWVLLKFASQDELYELECRMVNNVYEQIRPLYTGGASDQIELRNSHIRLLSKHGGGSPQIIAAINDLSDQISTLTKDQREKEKTFQENRDKVIGTCFAKKPQKEK